MFARYNTSNAAQEDSPLPRARSFELAANDEGPWERIVRSPLLLWRTALFCIIALILFWPLMLGIDFVAPVLATIQLASFVALALFTPVLYGWACGRGMGRTIARSPLVTGLLTTEYGSFPCFAAFLDRQLNRIVSLLILIVFLMVGAFLGFAFLAGFTLAEVASVAFVLLFFAPATFAFALPLGLLAFDISFRRQLRGGQVAWRAEPGLMMDVLLRVFVTACTPWMVIAMLDCLLLPVATAGGIALLFWCLYPLREMAARSWDALVAGTVGESLHD